MLPSAKYFTSEISEICRNNIYLCLLQLHEWFHMLKTIDSQLYLYHLVEFFILFNAITSTYLSKYNMACSYICTYIYVRYIVTIVHDSFTMLTSNQFGGASLKLLTACLLSSLFGITLPIMYKESESMV